ncbi:TadE/TadG family type IV pilus assembly protein [Microvirga alba]|uniref:Pilus assembly protein n=1 Tax=Microvirga alba TaxID=2791025 RepID=A0A931BS71_9HYPH|nr:TadE/TadG family type IV pilus assembly protein [Microvirga alba]MBF9234255.1 pilus assembly protein [Microvirga alba]
MRGDERGATAIEFALVAPVFLALVFGIFHLSLLGFTVASLNYAVEKGARCNAIATDCPDAAAYYFAPEPAPVFTSDKAAACGTLVNATVTYQLNVLIYQASIPLTASACFP